MVKENKKNILIEVKGGLGNQLFQFAFGKYLAQNTNKKIIIDDSYFQLYPEVNGVTKRNYELNYFKNILDERVEIGKVFCLFSSYRITYHAFQLWLKVKYRPIKITDESRIVFGMFSGSNLACAGYFQNRKYPNSIKDLLTVNLKIDSKVCGHNLVERINSANSVSIHIRRTDYLEQANTKLGQAVSLSYYSEAINHINSFVSEPTFFVFSDDQEWCKSNLASMNVENVVYVTANTGRDSYKDMILMSLCKHNIIANSTFSWWGAWLNANEQKIVICPKEWTSGDLELGEKLADENWVII